MGTIIRSCDALGADVLIITGYAVDLYDPEVIVSSMGHSLICLWLGELIIPRLFTYIEDIKKIFKIKSYRHDGTQGKTST